MFASVALLAGCATQGVRPFDAAGELELVTNPSVDPSTVWTRGADGVIGVSGKPAGYIATPVEAISGVLDTWDQHPGGAVGWFQRAGGTPQTIDRLRTTLVR